MLGRPVDLERAPAKGGRPKGAKNVMSKTIRDAICQAFDQLGGVEGLVSWAEMSNDNLSQLYNMWGRLAPREVHADVNGALTVIIRNEAANESAE